MSEIGRRYIRRCGHFKRLIYEIRAETRGFAGAIKNNTQDVHSIDINENEGKKYFKKNPDLRN